MQDKRGKQHKHRPLERKVTIKIINNSFTEMKMDTKGKEDLCLFCTTRL